MRRPPRAPRRRVRRGAPRTGAASRAPRRPRRVRRRDAAARAATNGSRRSAGSNCGQTRRSWSASRAVSSDSNASERSRPCAADLREALVLGEQARRLQRLLRLAAEARGLQLQAQRMGAARHAGRQFGQQFERARRVAVVERPLGGEQARALFGRARARRCGAPARARAAAARRARRGPAGGAALPAASRWPSTVNSLSCASSGVSAWIASARCGRLLRTAVATAEVLRQRVAQRRLRAAIAPRDAPLVRPPRQADQRVHAPGSAVTSTKQLPQQCQQEQVQRHVDAPAAPVER